MCSFPFIAIDKTPAGDLQDEIARAFLPFRDTMAKSVTIFKFMMINRQSREWFQRSHSKGPMVNIVPAWSFKPFYGFTSVNEAAQILPMVDTELKGELHYVFNNKEGHNIGSPCVTGLRKDKSFLKYNTDTSAAYWNERSTVPNLSHSIWQIEECQH